MKEPKLRFPGFTEDWEKCKLSELATMHARIGWQNLRTSEFLDNGDYLLITGTDFNDGTINYSTCHYVEKERYEQDKNIQLQNGSILITKDGTLGKVAYVQNLNMPATLNAGVFNVEIKDKNTTDSRYLFQYLKAPFLMNYASKNSTGGTIKHLNQNILVDFPVAIPKLNEQQKIASLFSEIDTLIQSAEKELEGYRELKQGMLQKMFPKNGETTPEIRFPEFTGDWEQRKLGELGEILTGSTPSTSNSAYYSEDGIPWVTPTDINELTISDTPKRLSEEGVKVGRIVPANTILCTCIASIGKNTLLTVKGSFNQQINSLTPNAENDAYFLLTESELWSNKMKRMAASGTMQIVNKTEFSSLDTLVPSTDEQKKIGSYFRNLDNLISIQQKELDGYKELKKGLLQQMFC